MTGEEYLVAHLNEQLKNLNDYVDGGRCTDWADYKNLCGQIRGVKHCLEAIEKVKEKLEQEENEDV